MRGICWIAENRLAYQEELYSIEYCINTSGLKHIKGSCILRIGSNKSSPLCNLTTIWISSTHSLFCSALYYHPSYSYEIWYTFCGITFCVRLNDPLGLITVQSPFLWQHTTLPPIQQNTFTLNLLTWKIGLTPDNASKQQMGFNSAFKRLKKPQNTVAVITTHLSRLRK
jgi:hypothetical protein